MDTYQTPDSCTYVVSELPRPMYDEVGVLPSLGACGEMNKSFVEINLWWSGGGSRSVIHKVSRLIFLSCGAASAVTKQLVQLWHVSALLCF